MKVDVYAFFINENFYGVTDSWGDCQSIVSAKSGAKYKKFSSRKEAGAYLKSLATK